MLTDAQVLTLRAAIAGETDPTFTALLAANDSIGMAAWFNANSTFVVWKTVVTITEIGDKINGTELAGLSSLNTTRLQMVVTLSAAGVNPSLSDRRQFFDDIFSGAGGTITRAALLALWKRFAKRGEKVFATGTGTDATPGLLVFEGSISELDVNRAVWNADGTRAV